MTNKIKTYIDTALSIVDDFMDEDDLNIPEHLIIGSAFLLFINNIQGILSLLVNEYDEIVEYSETIFVRKYGRWPDTEEIDRAFDNINNTGTNLPEYI
jgi:hypothetical protein